MEVTFMQAVAITVGVCALFGLLALVEDWLWQRRQDRREQEAVQPGDFRDWLEDVPADFDWRRSA